MSETSRHAPRPAGHGAQPPPEVSVIIPTTALAERRQQLERAIDSVLRQQGAGALPIVVINGTRFDPGFRSALLARSDIRAVYREEGSLPRALHVGRSLVDTEFFAELDDDDELLPAAMATRVASLRADREAALVVTNGYFRHAGKCTLSCPDITVYQADPLGGLIEYSWLVSCSGLFRTEMVGLEFFERIPGSLEWTYIALRVACERRVKFVNTPTFIYNRDTSDSLSKSAKWIAEQPAAIRCFLDLPLPDQVRAKLQVKYAAALHHASEIALSDGDRLTAWKLHLVSLVRPEGWRYASYTRRLLLRRRPSS